MSDPNTNFPKDPIRPRARSYLTNPPDNENVEQEVDSYHRHHFNEENVEDEESSHANLVIPRVIHSGSSPVSESNSSFISGLVWDPSADVGTVSDSWQDQARNLQYVTTRARSSSMTDLGTLERSGNSGSKAINAPIVSLKRNTNTRFDQAQGSSKDSVATVKDKNPNAVPGERDANVVYKNSKIRPRSYESFYKTPDSETTSTPSSSTRRAQDTDITHGSNNSSDSTRDHVDHEEIEDQQQFPPRGMSEASTDWEYGNSRSQSQDERSHSDWLTAGLTRSEIIYNKQNDSNSSGSRSPVVISDGIRMGQEARNRRARSETGNHSLLLVDRSVQTDMKDKEISDTPTPQSSASNSKSDEFQKHSSRPQHHSRHVHVESRTDTSSGDRLPHDQRNIQRHLLPQHVNYESSSLTTNGPDRAKHHRHHHRQNQRFHSLENSETKISSSTSTDLTPTCSFINHFIKNGVPITNESILKAIDTHRYDHIDKVRRELKHIRRLQTALEGGRVKDYETTSSSSKYIDSADRSHKHRKHNRGIETEREHHHSPSGIKHKRKDKEQKTECVKVKSPISYFLPFPASFHPIWFKPPPQPQIFVVESSDNEKENDEEYENEEDEWIELNKHLVELSLKDILLKRNAQFLNRAKERANVIARIRDERKRRSLLKREWILSHGGVGDLSSLERALPPKGPRLMTTREMRQQTLRKYNKLPEVQEKKLKQKSEFEKQTNRLMANYFAGRLQKGVLKGKVNVDPNRSLLRQ